VWHLIEVAESAEPNSFQDHYDYCLFAYEQYKQLQQQKKKNQQNQLLATAILLHSA
jgi:translation initiation factor IF-3